MNTRNTLCYLTTSNSKSYAGIILSISNRLFETLEKQKEKKYWSVADLEPFGVLDSQENWDNFKKTNLFNRFKLPDMVKGVLISRNIIP